MTKIPGGNNYTRTESGDRYRKINDSYTNTYIDDNDYNKTFWG
jgi:hypothetical protein